MGITVGAMIKELRKGRGITRERLCRGLCTPQMLELIEKDACETDQYLFDILLQRLGKSPDKLELILSQEEYRRMRARDLIEELCWKKKKDKALYLLEQYRHFLARESSVQKMYEYRVRTFISRRLDKDLEEAGHHIHRALETTLPGITPENMQEYMISGTELENLLALGLCMFEQGETKTAERLLESCRDYILRNVSDGEARALIYGKCGWLLSKIYSRREKYARAYDCCEEAIEGLRRFGSLYFMMPLLEQLKECGDKLGIEEKGNRWKIYHEILSGLYEDYGKAWYCHDSLFHNPHNTAYHLDSEFIRQERLAQEMTQEELIEGVYQSPEPLSRVENGRAKPTRNKLEGLLGKLGLERGRLCGTIAVDDFKVLELKKEIDILIGQWRYEEAERLLEELSEELDMEWKINRIVLGYYQTILWFKMKKSGSEETLEKLKALLRQSYWVKREGYVRVPLRSELLILNAVSALLGELDRYGEANQILRSVMEALKHSKVKLIYRRHIASLPYVNLMIHTKDVEYCKRGLTFELACGIGILVPAYLHILAYPEKGKNMAQYLKCIGQACNLCELFYRDKYKEMLKKIYKQYEVFNRLRENQEEHLLTVVQQPTD